MRALRKGMKAGARPLCPRSGLLPHLPEEKPQEKTTEKGLRKMAAHRLCLIVAVH